MPRPIARRGCGPRILFAEHGFQPRLPLSLQLVREADLGRHATTAASARLLAELARCSKRFDPITDLVRGRHFRPLATMDQEFAAAVESPRR